MPVENAGKWLYQDAVSSAKNDAYMLFAEIKGLN